MVSLQHSWYSELDGYWNTDDARRFSPSIQPIVLLSCTFAPYFTLSMGHYDTKAKPIPFPIHCIIRSFFFRNVPSRGYAFLLKAKTIGATFWIDWQRYATSSRQEARTLLQDWLLSLFCCEGRSTIGVALYATTSHRGGEINQMQATDIVRTYFATVAGLELRYTTKPLWREETLILDSEIYGAFSAIGQENAPRLGWLCKDKCLLGKTFASD